MICKFSMQIFDARVGVGFFLLLIVTIGAASPKHSEKIEDLKNLTLNRHQKGFQLSININHNALNLKAQLRDGRAWIKEALCKQCSIESQQCLSSCFGQGQTGKISCDTSFCSKLGVYSDQIFGVEGIETQVFLKLGNDKQILMSLVLANKLYENHSQSGSFSIFDSEASFNHAIITRSNASSLQLYNVNNLSQEEIRQLKQKQGDQLVFHVPGSEFNLEFLRASKVILHDVDSQKNILSQQMEQSNIQLSLQSSYLTLPIRLVKKIEKFLSQNYLVDKKCKLLPRKLKCSHQIQAKQLFRIMIHIQMNTQILALPIHMLFTSCSKNECTTLINYNESSDNHISIGYFIWELYNFEYNLEQKEIVFHQKNTQWDQLFDKDRYQIGRISFLYGIWLIIYHTCRYFLLFAFYMSIFAIVINCIVNRKKILFWFRGILLKRKGINSAENEEEQSFQQNDFKRISSRPHLIDDSELT